jgi:tetratricopeptide (TPR) repeat protein
MLRRIAFFFPLLFCLCAVAFAARMNINAANNLFARGNAEYQQQHYAEAKALYSQVIEAGVRSPDLFYNMGNACSRLGQTGEAVLYYEKARQLSPSDNDILQNLRHIAPPNNDPQQFILLRPLFWLIQLLPMRGWFLLFFVFYWLVAVSGVIYFLMRSFRSAYWGRILMRSLLVLMSASAVLALFAWYTFGHTRYAIVMKPDVRIYSGPGEKFVQLMAATEGTKVRQLQFNDPRWARVEAMDGQKGYIPAEVLRKI